LTPKTNKLLTLGYNDVVSSRLWYHLNQTSCKNKGIPLKPQVATKYKHQELFATKILLLQLDTDNMW